MPQGVRALADQPPVECQSDQHEEGRDEDPYREEGEVAHADEDG